MTTSTHMYKPAFHDMRPPARGLYVTSMGRAFLFKDLGGKSAREITLGRAPGCDIVLFSDQLLRVHATVETRGHTRYLVNRSTDYDSFADGWQVIKPVPLLVGMVIYLANVQLVATNDRGTFPINAETVSELCRKAVTLRGSHRKAGQMVKRSHNFVRRQFEPRDKRFRKKKTTSCNSTS